MIEGEGHFLLWARQPEIRATVRQIADTDGEQGFSAP